MKKVISLIAFLFFINSTTIFAQPQKISILTDQSSLKEIATELSTYLKSIYNDDIFSVIDMILSTGDVIILQTNTDFEIEEFKVSSNKNNNGQVILTISGGSTNAVKYGVFQFLEEIGFGFYLSHEMQPKNIGELELENIFLKDKPLVKNRLVFNWHNFLSGCSAWNLEEWKFYIDQTSKMRFNGLMTHFYANDPSFTFSHNGVEKAVGYMPNTKSGRQYGTQQVNDVTRMVGGEVFDSLVFGSETSKVPDRERVAKAKELVKSIHKYATSKSMKIWFGYDVDYPLANPPEIIATLPENAKINIKREPNKYFGMPDSNISLPIPDSPEGLNYYRSQINQLLLQYPEIDNLVLWTRTSGSAFLTLKYDEFPEKWKIEFDKIVWKNPSIDKKDENITGRFAVSKIYQAVRKCLDEAGKNEIKLWAGSWRVSWLEQANLFYPDYVGFIPLDYHTDYFSDNEKLQILKNISKKREVLPIIWAHHDDGYYIGSPYSPYGSLHSKIKSIGNTGIGVIHWTTKPLDIYFKNTEQQIWKRTRNATLQNTADFMARRVVSPTKINKMSSYLVDWVNNSPKFGRETRTYFIDRLIEDSEYQSVLQKGAERIQLLDEIGEIENPQIKYFKALEEFCIDFYKTQYIYQQALLACKSGNLKIATDLIKSCNPENTIQMYANASSINEITKGEKGVIVEMNLSWLPLINSLKQTLRQKPALYNFGLVNFPDMGVGLLNTNYFIDNVKYLWRNYGEAETGGNYFENSQIISSTGNQNLVEICSSGVKSEDSLLIEIKPIACDISPSQLKNPDYFAPGKYRITLTFNEHEYSQSGKRVFDIQISDSKTQTRLIKDSIDILALTGSRDNVLSKTYEVTLHENNSLLVLLKSINGECIINGLQLEPVQ